MSFILLPIVYTNLQKGVVMTNIKWSVRQTLYHVKAFFCDLAPRLPVKIHEKISAALDDQQGLAGSAHACLLYQAKYLDKEYHQIE